MMSFLFKKINKILKYHKISQKYRLLDINFKSEPDKNRVPMYALELIEIKINVDISES